jgi:putative flippase GtrA
MIRRELTLFLLVGCVSVLLDYFVYRTILHTEAVTVSVAKAVSFLGGTVFTYFSNRLLTFGHVDHRRGSYWRYGLLYSLTLGANVALNAIVLNLLRDVRAAVPLAFLTATGFSASLNFIGMKWFVFRRVHVSGNQ